MKMNELKSDYAHKRYIGIIFLMIDFARSVVYGEGV